MKGDWGPYRAPKKRGCFFELLAMPVMVPLAFSKALLCAIVKRTPSR